MKPSFFARATMELRLATVTEPAIFSGSSVSGSERFKRVFGRPSTIRTRAHIASQRYAASYEGMRGLVGRVQNFARHESGIGHTTTSLHARIRHRRSGGDDPCCEDLSRDKTECRAPRAWWPMPGGAQLEGGTFS